MASVAAGACWPDHLDGDTAVMGAGDHIGGPAIATGWLAVPVGLHSRPRALDRVISRTRAATL